MTWTSLWWRVCLLGRMHRRHLSLAWRLWKRSRRAARPVRLPYNSVQDIINAPIGAPIPLNEYRAITGAFVMQEGAWLELGAQQALMGQQALQDAQMQQMMNMARQSPYDLALLAGAQNALSGAGRT